MHQLEFKDHLSTAYYGTITPATACVERNIAPTDCVSVAMVHLLRLFWGHVTSTKSTDLIAYIGTSLFRAYSMVNYLF